MTDPPTGRLRRDPSPQRTRQAENNSASCSWRSSWSELFRKLVGITGILDVDLSGIGGVGEGKIVVLDFVPRLPIPDLDTVLRGLVNALGRDDVAAWIRLISLRDPYLPIHVLGTKCQMVALFATNHAA